MAFRATMKRGATPTKIVVSIVSILLVLWIGGQVIDSVSESIGLQSCVQNADGTCDLNSGAKIYDGNSQVLPFFAAYDFLGIDGENYSSGILVVIGLIAVAMVILNYVKVSF